MDICRLGEKALGPSLTDVGYMCFIFGKYYENIGINNSSKVYKHIPHIYMGNKYYLVFICVKYAINHRLNSSYLPSKKIS